MAYVLDLVINKTAPHTHKTTYEFRTLKVRFLGVCNEVKLLETPTPIRWYYA